MNRWLCGEGGGGRLPSLPYWYWSMLMGTVVYPCGHCGTLRLTRQVVVLQEDLMGQLLLSHLFDTGACQLMRPQTVRCPALAQAVVDRGGCLLCVQLRVTKEGGVSVRGGVLGVPREVRKVIGAE